MRKYIMQKKIVSLLPIAFVFLFAGCSPLLKKGNPVSQNPPVSFQEEMTQACPIRFEKLSLCAHLISQDFPIVSGKKLKFLLRFWSSENGSSEGPYIQTEFVPHVWLWMPMETSPHGAPKVHVKPQYNEDGKKTEGTYDVTNAIFTMNGKWEIHIELNQEGVRLDEAVKIIWI